MLIVPESDLLEVKTLTSSVLESDNSDKWRFYLVQTTLRVRVAVHLFMESGHDTQL